MVSTGSSRKSMMESFAKLENVENVDFSRRTEKLKRDKTAEQQPSGGNEFKNKQRVMLLCSRGITYRYDQPTEISGYLTINSDFAI
jgi:hypothetical protein